jgi:hypothetical protein
MNAFCFFETSGRVPNYTAAHEEDLDPQKNWSERRKFCKMYLFVYLGQLQ